MPKTGDRVRVRYTAMLEDGSIFDHSPAGEDLEFVVGKGTVIHGVEKAICAMRVGQQRKVVIPPKDGYGLRKEHLNLMISRNQLPDGTEAKPGDVIEVRSQSGDKTMQAMIQDIQGEQIVIDANHPLAGKTLIYDLELVEVKNSRES
jgi:peptidylprolyl isomerase